MSKLKIITGTIFSIVVLCVGYTLWEPATAAEHASVKNINSMNTDIEINNKNNDLDIIEITPANVVDTIAETKSVNQLNYDPKDPATFTATQHPYVIVPNDPNPRAQSIIEAHATKTFPERISVFHKGKPFNLEAWKKNKSEYLHVVEPSRIEDMHPPGGDIINIKRMSPYFQRM